ncbi:MAG: hypothetical protein EP319_00450 [Deltaproteobacteria bacterium]|nr:MAG: hypothetical protein EP319_00450 [Deltaproteobacteria bacterium]
MSEKQGVSRRANLLIILSRYERKKKVAIIKDEEFCNLGIDGEKVEIHAVFVDFGAHHGL